MTICGPRPRRPRRSRSPLPSPKPTDVRKSQRSTNVRGPLANDDDHLAGRRRDLGSAARAGQSRGRVLVVADDRRVDVAEAVELRGAEEADVDASGLQPVGEDLGHRHDRVGGLGQLAVADRQRQPRRLRPDAARLVDQRALRRVRAAGEVRGGRRQPDADEAHAVVAAAAGAALTIIRSSALHCSDTTWLRARCRRCGSTPRSRRCRARARRSRP